MVAGQSHGTATQSAADQLSWQAHRDSHSQPLPGVPGWIDTLQQLDARMIYFAHDRCVWSRDVSFRDDRRHRHLTGSAAAPSRTGLIPVRRRSNPEWRLPYWPTKPQVTVHAPNSGAVHAG